MNGSGTTSGVSNKQIFNQLETATSALRESMLSLQQHNEALISELSNIKCSRDEALEALKAEYNDLLSEHNDLKSEHIDLKVAYEVILEENYTLQTRVDQFAQLQPYLDNICGAAAGIARDSSQQPTQHNVASRSHEEQAQLAPQQNVVTSSTFEATSPATALTHQPQAARPTASKHDQNGSNVSSLVRPVVPLSSKDLYTTSVKGSKRTSTQRNSYSGGDAETPVPVKSKPSVIKRRKGNSDLKKSKSQPGTPSIGRSSPGNVTSQHLSPLTVTRHQDSFHHLFTNDDVSGDGSDVEKDDGGRLFKLFRPRKTAARRPEQESGSEGITVAKSESEEQVQVAHPDEEEEEDAIAVAQPSLAQGLPAVSDQASTSAAPNVAVTSAIVQSSLAQGSASQLASAHASSAVAPNLANDTTTTAVTNPGSQPRRSSRGRKKRKFPEDVFVPNYKRKDPRT